MKDGYLRYFNRMNEETKINLQRIQIEQDSAKSFHDFEEYSGIDYNRAGVALLEIVTYPEITHPTDAKIIVRELQETLKLLNISQANMDEGQMRCDLNISLKHKTDHAIQGNRVELKNVQGVRFVERAIECEILRQAELLDQGQNFPIQTRRYDVKSDSTVLLREKEADLDYRFMYDPDLPSYFISPQLIKSIESEIGLIPFDYKKKLIEKYQLSVEQVQYMYSLPELVDYFKILCEKLKGIADAQLVYFWIFTIFVGNCRAKEIENFKAKLDECIIETTQDGKTKDKLIELIKLQAESKILFANAKTVLYEIIDGDSRSPYEIAKERDWIDDQTKDINQINSIIGEVIRKNPSVAQKAISFGANKKGGPIMFLVGESMKALKAQGNPEYVLKYLKEKLFQ